METCPPIARSTSTNPMRPGFNETPSMRTSESGRINAATTRKAALDTSPGTAMWTASRRARPRTLTDRPERSTGTPKAGSRRSVWSRLGAGSLTVVTPSASSPASSTAVFTCALATGRSQVMGRRVPPSRVRGGLPSMPWAPAPMARSGAATRSTGRRQRDASPVRVLRNGLPASAPASMRRVEPEFPQSRASSGRLPGFRAAAVDRDLASLATDQRPRARPRQARVEAQSAAEEKFVRRVWPWARPPRIARRWERDLSPASRNRPWKRRAGWMRTLKPRDASTAGDLRGAASLSGSRA